MRTYFLLIISFFQSMILSAQDKNYSEWYLQRDDADIFVKEIKSGKDTVIVVHGGFGANHDYMLDALEGLKDTFYFILYDQRGSLLSPAKAEDLTFEKNIDDLLALTDALKLKKTKLFCHSMGTLVGMEFVKQHPDLVSHLVLAGAILPKSDSLKSVFSRRYEKQVNYLVNRKEVKELTEPYLTKGINDLHTVKDIETSELTHKDLTEYWRITFAAVNLYDVRKHIYLKGGRAYYKQSASVIAETVNWDYDYRNILNNNTKTTIINGDYDFLDFHGEAFKTSLNGYDKIELRIIPNAGHNSWIDNPIIFKDYLKNALLK